MFTSLVIVLPAPIVVLSPIDIGATKEVFDPMNELFPILVVCLVIPS